MRDPKFIAVHRGGTLTREDHRLLMQWALVCTHHVLEFATQPIDSHIAEALNIAEQWERGSAKTGAAMKAARLCHAIAQDTEDPIMRLIYRCIGHAVATAHMADHCLGSVYYGLKVAKVAGASVEVDQAWYIKQLSMLPKELSALIESSIKDRTR